MSWPTWSATGPPIPSAVAAPVQPTLMPSAINPAPAVMPPTLQYSQEQWAQAQQQNWQQWAQWQQQYQQWHQQYGAEYQKSLTAMQGSVPAATQPPLPAMTAPAMIPPLPVDNKPPLPPEEPPRTQTPAIASYTTMPPRPVQSGYSTAPPPIVNPHVQQPPPAVPNVQTEQYSQKPSWPAAPQKRPYAQENTYEQPKRQFVDGGANQWSNQKQTASSQWQGGTQHQQFSQPPPATPKPNVEELSEAEKKFDKEFAAWEAQFNKWKDQNANHPDKTQYKEYEKKWESWRNSLLERREQMRKKRLGLTGTTTAPTLPTNKPTQSFTQPPPTNRAPSVMTQPPPVTQPPPMTQPLLSQPPPSVNPPATNMNQPPPYGNQFTQPSPAPKDVPPAAALPFRKNEPPVTKPATDYAPPDDKPNEGEGFLKPAGASGGIPGLDLVKDDDKEEKKEGDEVVEIDKEDKKAKESPTPQQTPKGPDFDAISKGINSILGDQKLLSMLSMVSQNPPAAPPKNVTTDTLPNMTSGFNPEKNNYSAPPPQFQDFSAPPPAPNFNEGPAREQYNEKSNQSFEDRPNPDDYYRQREVVNNFDDQTRSSFTMGPAEPEHSFRNRGSPGRFGGMPPEQDRFQNRNNFGPGGVRKSLDSKFGAAGPGYGGDKFSEGPGNFYPRGKDNFNRNDSFKSKDDRFGRDQFQQDDDFQNNRFGPKRKSFENFEEDNFNQQDNFNQRDDRYNTNFNRPSNYRDRDYDDYDNYNDDDYDRYHNLFNEDDQNYDQKFDQDYDQEYDQRYDEQFDPKYNQKFDPKYDQKFDQKFDPKYDQNFDPKYDQKYDQKFDPKYDQKFDPKYDQKFDPKYDQQFDPKYDQKFDPKYDQKGDNQFEKPFDPKFNQPSFDEGPRGEQAPPQMVFEPPPPQIEPPPPVEEPIFEPTVVIDYDHKSKNPPEPEITVEPFFTFDYRHKPLNRIPYPQRPKWLADEVKFIREFDPLASRTGIQFERPPLERYPVQRADDRFARGRYDDRDRKVYDTDRYIKSERIPTRSDIRRDERENAELHKRKNDSEKKDKNTVAEGAKKNDKKRNIKDDFEELSDEDMQWDGDEKKAKDPESNKKSRSKSPFPSNPPSAPSNLKEITLIEDILNPPGRFNRPPRIVIIIRGPPGSGKTYLAKQIKDKEVEHGGSAPRILSLDDYFMVEHEKEVIEDGKTQKVKEMVYEYEAEMEESYRASFVKSFKKTITDGYFPFIIVDNVNEKVKYFGEMWSFAKQNGFQVYICEMDLDPVLCTKRNLHNRTEKEIEDCIAGWEPTPSHHPTLDASSLLQSSGISEVEMEVEEQQSKPAAEAKPEGVPEQSSMESTNPSESHEPWKSSSKWKMTGNPQIPQNRGRRGYGGPIWRSRGNRRR